MPRILLIIIVVTLLEGCSRVIAPEPANSRGSEWQRQSGSRPISLEHTAGTLYPFLVRGHSRSHRPCTGIGRGINAGFTLSASYALSAHAKLTRFDADACNLSLANFNATPVIRPIATDAIKKALDHLNDEVSRYDIRKLIEPYWVKLFQPVKINDIGYISLNPSHIRLENLNGSAHQLTCTIGITAKPVFSLANPGPPTVTRPLPVISRQDAGGFNVYVDARIQYAELNRLAKTHLDNHKIAVGKTGYFMVKNAGLYGVGNDHLLIRMDFN